MQRQFSHNSIADSSFISDSSPSAFDSLSASFCNDSLLSASSSASSAAVQERLEQLRSRKRALEDSLKVKLAQLRNLCVNEAELTGSLPPETPLDEQSELPPIKKRIGTAFNLSQAKLDRLASMDSQAKPITDEEQALAEAELQVEALRNIVQASEKLCKDQSLTSKKIRKQRKAAYAADLEKLKSQEKRLFELQMHVKRLHEKGVAGGVGRRSANGKSVNFGQRFSFDPTSATRDRLFPSLARNSSFQSFSSIASSTSTATSSGIYGASNGAIAASANSNAALMAMKVNSCTSQSATTQSGASESVISLSNSTTTSRSSITPPTAAKQRVTRVFPPDGFDGAGRTATLLKTQPGMRRVATEAVNGGFDGGVNAIRRSWSQGTLDEDERRMHMNIRNRPRQATPEMGDGGRCVVGFIHFLLLTLFSP